MKQLKTILSITFFSFLFTFCVNNKSEKKSDITYTTSELLGKWNLVSKNKTLQDKDSKVESIHLINDSIAEIQLINSTDEKVLIGRWENGFNKKLQKFDLEFESDIKVTYFPDKYNTNILLLKLSKENEKIVMSADKLKFEKE